MTKSKLLAICIPTFNRPEELISNLNRLKLSENLDLLVVVSSNKIEVELEKYCSKHQNILFLQHEDNWGFTRNLREVLLQSRAEFSLILSDEDFISQENLNSLKIKLSSDTNKNKVYLAPPHDLFTLSSLSRMTGESLSYLDIAATNPHIPTYMSGFVFPTSAISHEFLCNAFELSQYNAYPFLVLRNHLLQVGYRFEILSNIRIQRGRDSNNRDPDANYVSQQINLDRVNYFLVRNDFSSRRFSIINLHIALLLYAQVLPSIKLGYLSIRFKKFKNNRHGFELYVSSKPSMNNKFWVFLSFSAVYLSHAYRRIAMLLHRIFSPY